MGNKRSQISSKQLATGDLKDKTRAKAVIILGTEAVGRSTLCRVIQLLNLKSKSSIRTDEWIPFVRQGCVDVMLILLKKFKKCYPIQYAEYKYAKDILLINNCSIENFSTIKNHHWRALHKLAKALNRLWNDQYINYSNNIIYHQI